MVGEAKAADLAFLRTRPGAEVPDSGGQRVEGARALPAEEMDLLVLAGTPDFVTRTQRVPPPHDDLEPEPIRLGDARDSVGVALYSTSEALAQAIRRLLWRLAPNGTLHEELTERAVGLPSFSRSPFSVSTVSARGGWPPVRREDISDVAAVLGFEISPTAFRGRVFDFRMFAVLLQRLAVFILSAY